MIRFLLFISFSVPFLNFAVAESKDIKQTAKEAITEIFLKRNPEAIDKYVTEDYIQHQPGLPNGREPFKEYLKILVTAFPDYNGEIESIVAEGDLVSLHFKWTGTHKGTFMGVPATGKKISRRTADVLRIKGGKIVEHWGVVDQVDMLKELGLLKPVK